MFLFVCQLQEEGEGLVPYLRLSIYVEINQHFLPQ